MFHIAALAFGFLIDHLLGDPPWLPHPIRAIGRLIEVSERLLRRIFPATKAGLRAAGVVLVVLVAGASTAVAAALLWACYRISLWVGFPVEAILCYLMIAARSLDMESMKVYDALEHDGLDAGRAAVAMIVGRDTDSLDEEGVVKATVETIAENTSDGVVAPVLFMAVGGAAAGVFYKAVTTMDSMVGYKHDRYR
ncbi:MAG: cobalamin biosynthesis protein [Eggerthellaceae bacterium]|nr:cobalamin biosynthesis protein [Eggerthellaceae bacterium]